jgi:oligopeptidase A
MTIKKTNPLLSTELLPEFSKILPEHIVPAVSEMLKNTQEQLKTILDNISPSWENTIEPLSDIEDEINKTWGPITHLQSVKNSKEFREEYEKVISDVITFSLSLSQNKILYDNIKQTRQTSEWNNYSSSKKRIINSYIKEAELSGVDLSEQKKSEFQKISQDLSKLETDFSNNVLDATKEYKLILTKKEDVVAIPNNYLQLFAQNYNYQNKESKKSTAEEGPWLIGLDAPSFIPFMEYCTKKELRKELYLAYIQRSSSGEFDNSNKITQILLLRKQKAKLLGFNNFAQLSLQNKMAKNVEEVYKLHEDLKSPALTKAKQEFLEISNFTKQQGVKEDLAHWDIAFYSRAYRDEKFNFSHEELKPYFPIEQALEGMFSLVQNIFDITVKEQNGIDVWHKDVKFFKIYNKNNKHLASFFLDPYSRVKNKRGGAWMGDCISRRKLSTNIIRIPVAYLVCNFTPPLKETPSLLSFRDVETLFHEFGHGLQHMLTEIDELDSSGINNIEWDAVELPSQFMENWCYHNKTFFSMAKHYKTKETIPSTYYEKILSSRTYLNGIQMLRQIQFGLIDMILHDSFNPDENNSVFLEYEKISKDISILPPLKEDKFLCSFSHIFSGSYAAGYYSYKWAEVLSADAFSAFEEVGLDNNAAIQKVGKKFRSTILAKGGSEDPKDIFKEFRGREQQTSAFLRYNGLEGCN